MTLVLPTFPFEEFGRGLLGLHLLTKLPSLSQV
jgi:hypothetical protein